MDFSSYVNHLAHPRKEDFTSVYIYSAGKVIWEGSLAEYNDRPDRFNTKQAGVVEKVVNEQTYRIALAEHMRHSANLMAKFKSDLKEEFGVTDHPKADAVYKLAYDYGHGSGLGQIYDYFSDLVDLIT